MTLPKQMIVTIDNIVVWGGPAGPGTTKRGNLKLGQEVTASKESELCFYVTPINAPIVIGWVVKTALKDKISVPPLPVDTIKTYLLEVDITADKIRIISPDGVVGEWL